MLSKLSNICAPVLMCMFAASWAKFKTICGLSKMELHISAWLNSSIEPSLVSAAFL